MTVWGPLSRCNPMPDNEQRRRFFFLFPLYHCCPLELSYPHHQVHPLPAFLPRPPPLLAEGGCARAVCSGPLRCCGTFDSEKRHRTCKQTIVWSPHSKLAIVEYCRKFIFDRMHLQFIEYLVIHATRARHT